jgi:hypothetical protein
MVIADNLIMEKWQHDQLLHSCPELTLLSCTVCKQVVCEHDMQAGETHKVLGHHCYISGALHM